MHLLRLKWYKNNRCYISKCWSCYILRVFGSLKTNIQSNVSKMAGQKIPKPHSSTETLKNKQKLLEQICQNSEKQCLTAKQILGQGKVILKWQESFVAFLLVCAPHLPQYYLAVILKTATVFPVWDPGPCFQREQSRFYSQISEFVYSNLPGSFLKE